MEGAADTPITITTNQIRLDWIGLGENMKWIDTLLIQLILCLTVFLFYQNKCRCSYMWTTIFTYLMAQYTEVFRISPHLIIYLQIPDINIFNNQSPPYHQVAFLLLLNDVYTTFSTEPWQGMTICFWCDTFYKNDNKHNKVFNTANNKWTCNEKVISFSHHVHQKEVFYISW